MAHDQVQTYAVRLTGERLPSGAFPRPAPIAVQVIEAARKLGWISGS